MQRIYAFAQTNTDLSSVALHIHFVLCRDSSALAPFGHQFITDSYIYSVSSPIAQNVQLNYCQHRSDLSSRNVCMTWRHLYQIGFGVVWLTSHLAPSQQLHHSGDSVDLAVVLRAWIIYFGYSPSPTPHACAKRFWHYKVKHDINYNTKPFIIKPWWSHGALNDSREYSQPNVQQQVAICCDCCLLFGCFTIVSLRLHAVLIDL